MFAISIKSVVFFSDDWQEKGQTAARRQAVLVVAELEKVAEDFNRKAKTEQLS